MPAGRNSRDGFQLQAVELAAPQLAGARRLMRRRGMLGAVKQVGYYPPSGVCTLNLRALVIRQSQAPAGDGGGREAICLDGGEEKIASRRSAAPQHDSSEPTALNRRPVHEPVVSDVTRA